MRKNADSQQRRMVMPCTRVVAALIGLALVWGAPAMAWGDRPPPGTRTEIGDIPWEPASLTQNDGKVIYGEDERIDVYQETDPQRLLWAAATCALVDVSQLTKNADGTYTLSLYEYSYMGYPACEEEPFANQPVAAFCTGFMVGTDLIATAGHCYDATDLADVRFIFGFIMLSETIPVAIFTPDQIYQGVEVVAHALYGDYDHAIIRVDRPIVAPKATPFQIRREGVIEKGTKVGAIGHPNGLPMKLAFGENTVVKDNSPEAYFTTNADTFGGNSGSPVINAETGIVEGIHVRGYYPRQYLQGSCFLSVALPDDGAPLYGEESKTTVFEEYVSELGMSIGQYSLRATPSRDAKGKPAIAVTWDVPADVDYNRVVLLRAFNDFAWEPGDGLTLYTGKEAQYLDENVQEGVEYFYTLIVYLPTSDLTREIITADFARGTAGAEASNPLAEAFAADYGKAIDLSFSQLLFSPVNPPRGAVGRDALGGDVGDYEVTYRENVYDLPVARTDARGGAWQLTVEDDDSIGLSFGNSVFPYMGANYSQVTVAANGYIAFDYYPSNNLLNYPITSLDQNAVLDNHFAVPRISFLFADLAPNVSGTLWGRILPDRAVITYENVPEYYFPSPFGELSYNTVQVELFFSGHIRFTYQNVGARNAVVGLSDGRGRPVNVAARFAGYDPTPVMSDLTGSPALPQRLTFDWNTSSARTQAVNAGELIRFTTRAVMPAGMAGVPLLTAEWTGNGTVPFADNNNGAGVFTWPTNINDDGIYTVRIHAVAGAARAYQDVRLVVGRTFPAPQALHLGVSSNTAFEDPTEDRVVPVGSPLIALYDYYHPWANEKPAMYGEGPSIIYWYRNGQMVPGLTNQRTVPPIATRTANDQWWFWVLPVTASYYDGSEVMSPIITIAGQPIVERVDPAEGPLAGGQTVRVSGLRLNGVLSVKFGGVAVSSVRAINANELEVVTPPGQMAGPVAVLVQTVGGIGSRSSAYTYQAETPPDPEPEKRGAALGCGAGPASSGGNMADILLICGVVAFLCAAARKREHAPLS